MLSRITGSRTSRSFLVFAIGGTVACADDAPADSQDTGSSSSSDADTTATTSPTNPTSTADTTTTTEETSVDTSSSSGMVDTTGTASGFTLAGAAAKGPLVLGSTVSVATLDEDGTPTGLVFMTQTDDDLGQFSVDVDEGTLVSVEAEGFHFNEVVGALSNATVTLRAYYESNGEAAQDAFVNLVTHLAYERTATLVGGGAVFTDAREQTEDELLDALGIGVTEFDPAASGTEMNLLGGDTDPNAYLFAVSAVVTQAAVTRAGGIDGPVDANLQELLNTISEDLADDGVIAMTLADELLAAQQAVAPESVIAALQGRLDMLGSSAVAPDLNRILDSDLDDIVNADDNCRRVANPLQEDADTDGVGDACECGNGTIDEGEVCDDGNSEDDDECAPECVPTCEQFLDWEPVDQRAWPVAAIGDLFLYADEDGLWATDGVGGAPVMLTDGLFNYDAPWGHELDGTLLVFGPGGVYSTDGTAANTTEVSSAGAALGDPYGRRRLSFEFEGRLYYPGGGVNGDELWVTDGTPAGTELLATLPLFSQPGYFVALGGAVYFRTLLASGYDQLWVTDGTSDGTEMVMEFTGASSDALDLVVIGSQLVFTARSQSGQHLYTSDGTAAGTAPLAMPFETFGEHVVLFEGNAYLSGESAGGEGQELWRTDGTLAGTQLVADLAPGSESSRPSYFTPTDDGFYMSTCGNGCGLWFSDGTDAGTVEIDPDATLIRFLNLLVDDRYYLVTDNHGLDGSTLWSTDGTALGTGMILDVEPGDALDPQVQFASPVVSDSWVYVYARRVGGGNDDGSTWRCRR